MGMGVANGVRRPGNQPSSSSVEELGIRGSMGSEKQEFEFMGPWLGPCAVVMGLPAVCYGLFYTCNQQGCLQLWPEFFVPGFPPGTRLVTAGGFGVFVLWLAIQALLHLLVPGRYGQGVQLADGNRLNYKFTGLSNFAITITACLVFGFYTKHLNLAWAYDNFLPLLTASWTFSMALSVALYVCSFRDRSIVLAPAGNTGHVLYDFFMGRELNPRIGRFDLKEWCELYPGLIGWVVLDLAMAAKQQQQLGYVSTPLLMVCVFHAIYVVDALWMETAILTTMDITTEGFGFMLAFGDLTWVPFTYSLQARYLVDHPQVISRWALAAILFLNALAYLIFRGSNSQKNSFRQNPDGPSASRLRTLQTASGRRLIVSGWWGVSRHINYFGDWLLGWSWCLPCGFRHIIPYFYVAYFGALLVHRDLRDEHACAIKYGKDWDRYCSLVKYRIIPLIY